MLPGLFAHCSSVAGGIDVLVSIGSGGRVDAIEGVGSVSGAPLPGPCLATIEQVFAALTFRAPDVTPADAASPRRLRVRIETDVPVDFVPG